MVKPPVFYPTATKKSRLCPKKVQCSQGVTLSKTSARSIGQATLAALLFVTIFGVFLSNEQLRKIDIEIEVRSSLLRARRTRLNISEIEVQNSSSYAHKTSLINSSSSIRERRGRKETVAIKRSTSPTKRTKIGRSSSPTEREAPIEHRTRLNTSSSAGHCGVHAPNAHFPRPRTYSRGECSCTPVRFFVVMSMQRSGSGWFETLLNSHPNISSNGEIFSVPERRANASSIARMLDKVYNLDWPTTAAKLQCTSAVGFKWQLNQGVMDHSEAILKYIRTKKVFVIFLFRRNLLRRLISALANDYDRRMKRLNGIHKSHAHSKEEVEKLAQFKPTIDTPVLKFNLSMAEQAMKDSYKHFRNTNHKLLFYEDILRNDKILTDVQTFLGVPVRKLKSKQMKIHAGPTLKLIENWKDVQRTLNGTKDADLLYKDDHDGYVDMVL